MGSYADPDPGNPLDTLDDLCDGSVHGDFEPIFNSLLAGTVPTASTAWRSSSGVTPNQVHR
jgi:hypothetical protein